MTSPYHLLVGLWGEAQAAAFLRAQGWTILGRRVKPDDRHEIDILARQDRVLVFVEVKTRRNETFGSPLRAVDRRKRLALCRAALRYLRRLRPPADYFRFDVVEVIGRPLSLQPRVRLVENAFPLDRRYFCGP